MKLMPRNAYNHKRQCPNPVLVTSRSFEVVKPEFINAPASVMAGEDVFEPLKFRLEEVHDEFIAEVHFSRTDYYVGEKIRFKISVDNTKCEQDVKNIGVQLVRVTSATAGPNDFKTITDEQH